jgi:hypothetical protein
MHFSSSLHKSFLEPALVPYCYHLFPLWLVAGLLLLVTLSVLYFVWEPMLHTAGQAWSVVLTLLVADSGSALLIGTRDNRFFAINNVVLVMVVIGITNLLAQSGIKARDVVVLSALVAVYDFIATAQLPLTNNLLVIRSSDRVEVGFVWPIGLNTRRKYKDRRRFQQVFMVISLNY